MDVERAGGGLWVRLLGPLDVRLGGVPVAGLGGKPGIVLAALALSAGRSVGLETLAQAVWGDRPPRSVRASLQTLVLRLRHLVGHEVVRTAESGYVLDVDPGCVDVLRFRQLVAESTAAEDAGHVRGLLGEALGLWRGDPFAGLRSDFLEEVVTPQLVEERLGALERRIDIDLAAGGHAELTVELRDLASRHPLREPLWRQLITALARSGRPAEALGMYDELRIRLRGELGVEPSAELRALHRDLLAGPAPGAGRPVDTAPDLLPPDTGDFTGRSGELATLRRVLTEAGPAAITVSGRPGIGKTALAVHAAHELGRYFPDGRLYADLRGTAEHPRDPTDVLDGFLRVLGVDGPSVPSGLDARAELYRTRLANRRVLVVLDDSAGEGQVRPLIPGGPGSAALITGRAALAGLEGVRRLELDLPEPGEAVELLARVSGRGRVSSERVAAEEIARLCARLPLALRIAGARLAARPQWRLPQLAERLRDERRRLDELVQGDLEVRASIGLSYRGLSELERRALRGLGMLAVPEFSPWMVAALLEIEAAAAADVLERLRDVHLVEVCGRGEDGGSRFRFHDLLRLFARERAQADETPDVRRAALRRVLATACRLLERGAPRPGFGRSRPDVSALPVIEVGDPIRWFEDERVALAALVVQACEVGIGVGAGAPAASMAPYFEVRWSFDDWRHTHELALAAVAGTGDRGVEGALLGGLGDLHLMEDRWDEALARFEQALGALGEADDHRGEATALVGSGLALRAGGRPEGALAGLQRASAIAGELDDHRLLAEAALALAGVHLDLGRVEEAAAASESALAEARAAGYRVGAMRALRSLGQAAMRRGDDEAASERLEAAVALSRALEGRFPAARALARLELAELRRRQGRHSEARALLETCLDVYRTLGMPSREAQTLRLLAELDRS